MPIFVLADNLRAGEESQYKSLIAVRTFYIFLYILFRSADAGILQPVYPYSQYCLKRCIRICG